MKGKESAGEWLKKSLLCSGITAALFFVSQIINAIFVVLQIAGEGFASAMVGISALFSALIASLTVLRGTASARLKISGTGSLLLLGTIIAVSILFFGGIDPRQGGIVAANLFAGAVLAAMAQGGKKKSAPRKEKKRHGYIK